MKIRKGFVSNSSSSSFCILGIKLSLVNKKLVELAKKELGDEWEDSYETDTYENAESLGLKCHKPNDSFYVIGFDISGRTFKEVGDLEVKLKEMFGDLVFRVFSGGE